MLRYSVILVLVAMLAVCTAPAMAVPLPIDIMDIGPCFVLGDDGGLYPLDARLKLIPVEYNEPIPTDGFLGMLEGIGKYTLANLGIDLLVPASLSAEGVAAGASLPVINAKVFVPVRVGVACIGGVGTRLFLRAPLLAGDSSPSATELAGLAPMGANDRSLTLAASTDSAMVVYTALLR